MISTVLRKSRESLLKLCRTWRDTCKDMEKLWQRYQSEGVAHNMSIQQFCSMNNVPYNSFEKYLVTRRKMSNVYPVTITDAPVDKETGKLAEEQKPIPTEPPVTPDELEKFLFETMAPSLEDAWRNQDAAEQKLAEKERELEEERKAKKQECKAREKVEKENEALKKTLEDKRNKNKTHMRNKFGRKTNCKSARRVYVYAETSGFTPEDITVSVQK